MSWGDFLLLLLAFVGVFLMFVILLQRGRGGGLAGAFGGLGGQSAFGTKAGDVFTVITVVTVVIWVVLACVAGARLRYENSNFMKDRPDVDEVKKAAEGAGQEPGAGNIDDGPLGGPEKDVPSDGKKPTDQDGDGNDSAAGSKPAETKATPESPAPDKPESKSTDKSADEKPDAGESKKSESPPEN